MPLEEDDDVGGCSVKSKACAPELRAFGSEGEENEAVVVTVEAVVAVGGVAPLLLRPVPLLVVVGVVGAINEDVSVVCGAVTVDVSATSDSFESFRLFCAGRSYTLSLRNTSSSSSSSVKLSCTGRFDRCCCCCDRTNSFRLVLPVVGFPVLPIEPLAPAADVPVGSLPDFPFSICCSLTAGDRSFLAVSELLTCFNDRSRDLRSMLVFPFTELPAMPEGPVRAYWDGDTARTTDAACFERALASRVLGIVLIGGGIGLFFPFVLVISAYS